MGGGQGSGVPRVTARRPWVIHPYLVGVFPILSLYAKNVYETRPGDLVWPLALAVATALGLWAVARGVLRDGARAGLVASLALVLFYTVSQATASVNRALEECSRYWVERPFDVWPPLVVGAELAVFAVLVYLAAARLRNPSALTNYLNVFAAVLVALPSVSAVRLWARAPARPVLRAPALAVAPGAGRAPDIYYIVLDGFARGDVLKELFGYDLEPFLRRLERRGFFVARRSTANYCQTPLSLASSLNATYLDGLVNPDSQDTGALGALIGEGAVIRALRSHGYKFVTYATGFDQTDHPTADVYRSPRGYVSGFHRLLLTGTPLWRLLPNPVDGDGYTMARNRTLFLLDTLPEVARDPSPTFTFAHVVAPHPPFVFGEDGEDVSPHGVAYYLTDGNLFYDHYGARVSYNEAYRGEAAYLVRRVEQVVERLLADSPEPPVIILQSDHGSGSRLDVTSMENSDLHERMGILNAYHLPGPARAGLYDTITPVNSFRVVFNACLGARLPLLPDRSYFSTWGEPFRFVDVTDRVSARPEGMTGPR